MKLKMLVFNKQRSNLLHSNLYSYNSNLNVYNKYKINDLIYNKKKRFVSIFKDHLILDDKTEFLNFYYLKSISETYFKIFLTSKEFQYKNYINAKINKIMINNIESKLNIKKRKNIKKNKITYNSINIKKNIEEQSQSTTLKNSLYYPSKENSKTIDLEYKGDFNKELYLSNDGSKVQKEDIILSFYEENLFEKQNEIKIIKILTSSSQRIDNINNKTMNKLNKGNNFVHDYFNKAIFKNNPNTKYYFPIKLQLKNIEKNKLNENDSHTNYSSQNTQKSSFLTKNSNKNLNKNKAENKNRKNNYSHYINKKKQYNLNSNSKDIKKKNKIKTLNIFNNNNYSHCVRNFSLKKICKTEYSKEKIKNKDNINNINYKNYNVNNKTEKNIKNIKNKSIDSLQSITQKKKINNYSQLKKDKRNYCSLNEKKYDKTNKLNFLFPEIFSERIKVSNKIIKK